MTVSHYIPRDQSRGSLQPPRQLCTLMHRRVGVHCRTNYQPSHPAVVGKNAANSWLKIKALRDNAVDQLAAMCQGLNRRPRRTCIGGLTFALVEGNHDVWGESRGGRHLLRGNPL